MKKIFLFLLVVFAFAAGIVLTWQFTKPLETSSIEQSTILLERVRKVCKLVTVEGDISETYKGGDIKNFTFYLPFPTTLPAQKQAVINVTGTVMVGYDLKQMTIDMDEENRIMRLSNLPEPTVLSVDHELSYFNIEESWFNTFTAEDYTRLNKEAKAKLREAAEKGTLIEEARQQGMQLFDIIKFMAEASGWTVQFEALTPEVVPLLED